MLYNTNTVKYEMKMVAIQRLELQVVFGRITTSLSCTQNYVHIGECLLSSWWQILGVVSDALCGHGSLVCEAATEEISGMFLRFCFIFWISADRHSFFYLWQF